MKLRRSIIWIGGDNEDKLKKALESDADAFCFDVEDGVLPNNKEYARQKIAGYLEKCDFRGREAGVRINGLTTEYWHRDLEVLLPAKPSFLRIPKCNSVEDLLKLDGILSLFEKQNNLTPNSIELILMIEDPLGLLKVFELCTCSKRITAVGIGLEDFTTAMGMPRSYDLNSLQLIYAKQKLVVAAKAAGIQALDSCSLMQEGSEYLLEDSKISRSFGFDGRSAGEISHIDITNSAFSPSKEEIHWAQTVVQLYDESVRQNNPALLTLDGKAIDWPVVVKAERLLEMDRAIQNKSVIMKGFRP